jgi:hypothetical protein
MTLHRTCIGDYFKVATSCSNECNTGTGIDACMSQ